MLTDFKLAQDRPVMGQVKEYLAQLIRKGVLQADQKLPSTRELAGLLKVSRTTILAVYADLEEAGLIYAVKGRGHFISQASTTAISSGVFDWSEKLSDQAQLAEEMDLMKHGIRWEKGMIAFTSIAPDEKLFDLNNVKRAFLDRISIEGEIILNYGYAKGYKPLIDYLLRYMENKGVDLAGKDLLITNGFTEGFDLVVSTLNKTSGRVLCENPTHHTALKILKLHGFDVTGIAMERDGVNMRELAATLAQQPFDLAYLIPSYQNPTGIVTSPEKRMEVLRLCAEHQVPIIEDGFNEELRYSGSHVAPLVALGGSGNGVIYIGSFAKILFPGLRVGWILADKELISYLESMKRARSIHTSTLDQIVLYQYLHNGNFDKYLKKAKAVYKQKYERAIRYCREYVPFKQLSGNGGLHLFLTLEESIRARDVLQTCYERGVVFTPGDIFFTDGRGSNTLRLGFSRVADEDLHAGIRIIGEAVHKHLREGST